MHRTDSPLTVRDATVADAAGCAAVYAPYVADTCITFELDPPSDADVAGRIAGAQRAHAWVVGEIEGDVAGYAYAGSYRPRAAYRWSCETSVYVAGGQAGRGVGRALYAVLLDRLTTLGYRTVVAGMTLPNEASVRLHTALGFEPVGTFRRVGHKHGAWHDVAWMQRDLGEPGRPPPPITAGWGLRLSDGPTPP